MTTHYLDEADKLCDRIGVINGGRNVVEDTPEGLERRIGEADLGLRRPTLDEAFLQLTGTTPTRDEELAE